MSSSIREISPADATEDLQRWVRNAGWAGWDPYDVRAHPTYLFLSRRARTSALFRVALGALYHTEQRFPRFARTLLRARPSINAKGMGLFARASSLLGDDAEASRRIGWLLANTSSGWTGTSWGYPFDWQSDVFIPRGTPSAVVTCTVADALRTHRPEEHEAPLRGVAEFLAGELHRTVRDTPMGSAHCFSYTPTDRFCIHNASLMAAEYLMWAGQHFDVDSWLEAGRRAVRYTLADQRDDGAWDYWGPDHADRPPDHVDVYHTGFVLRMLLRVHDTTGESQPLDAAMRGYAFFHRTLFEGARPRHTDRVEAPVNIHAVAEAILTHQAFRVLDPAALDRARDVVAWAVGNMRDPSGYFHYLWTPRRRNRLPMMRWGQGWMLLALAALMSEKRIL